MTTLVCLVFAVVLLLATGGIAWPLSALLVLYGVCSDAPKVAADAATNALGGPQTAAGCGGGIAVMTVVSLVVVGLFVAAAIALLPAAEAIR